MKTTVNIPESLMDEAKKIAFRERTSVKALIEEGLRRTLDERKKRNRFQLRKASFKGKGLQSDAATASWDNIREMAYNGRGE